MKFALLGEIRDVLALIILALLEFRQIREVRNNFLFCLYRALIFCYNDFRILSFGFWISSPSEVRAHSSVG